MKTRLAYIFGTILFALSIAILLSTLLASASPTVASTTWADDFSNSSLDSRWSWVGEDPTHWSLTANPGFLRITTKQTFSGFNNLLVQTAPPGNYEIQTRIVFTPTENFQIASLVVHQDDNNYLQLGRAYCGYPPPNCVGNGIYYDYVENGTLIGSNYGMTTTSQGDAYLKVMRHGNIYTGYVSTDNVTWTLVGTHSVSIAPTRIGLHASNQMQGATEISSDFDFFNLIDHSHHLFLPLILR